MDSIYWVDVASYLIVNMICYRALRTACLNLEEDPVNVVIVALLVLAMLFHANLPDNPVRDPLGAAAFIKLALLGVGLFGIVTALIAAFAGIGLFLAKLINWCTR